MGSSAVMDVAAATYRVASSRSMTRSRTMVPPTANGSTITTCPTP